MNDKDTNTNVTTDKSEHAELLKELTERYCLGVVDNR